jgi:Subtilase family
MCNNGSGNSVICGPRRQVVEFVEFWTRSATMERFGSQVHPPKLIDLTVLDWLFKNPDSPAIAVMHHAPGIGIPLTRQLQVEFMVGSSYFHPLPELICEPGQPFHGTHSAGGGSTSSPQVHLDTMGLARISRSLPSISDPAPGRRVALLDTGLDPTQVKCAASMVDFTDIDNQGVRITTPADPHGHGTAMAQIVLDIKPAADIEPIRVLNDANEGESYEILASLQYALYSNKFDCVMACLSAPAFSTCESSLGRSIEWMLSYANMQPQIAVPMVVAAAGNDGPQTNSQYLAQMAGVIVAEAEDENGNYATYNSAPPPNAVTRRAYGGTSALPVGDIANSEPLYGTSIAAAAITGAYLR